MKRIFRVVAIAVAIATSTTVSIAPPSQAATADAFTLAGGGAFSPGLSVSPQPQNFDFNGSGVAIGTGGLLMSANCTVSGQDLIGSIALGEGNLTIGCSLGSDSVSVPATFVRVDLEIIIVSAAGIARLGAGVCAALNTGVMITGFLIECQAADFQSP